MSGILKIINLNAVWEGNSEAISHSCYVIPKYGICIKMEVLVLMVGSLYAIVAKWHVPPQFETQDLMSKSFVVEQDTGQCGEVLQMTICCYAPHIRCHASSPLTDMSLSWDQRGHPVF